MVLFLLYFRGCSGEAVGAGYLLKMAQVLLPLLALLRFRYICLCVLGLLILD